MTEDMGKKGRRKIEEEKEAEKKRAQEMEAEAEKKRRIAPSEREQSENAKKPRDTDYEDMMLLQLGMCGRRQAALRREVKAIKKLMSVRVGDMVNHQRRMNTTRS